MTTSEERNFVRNYAARDFTGEGAIVDLGCWMGSFTLPLATGLPGPARVRKKLLVQLVNDAGAWKIDQVQGRDGGD